MAATEAAEWVDAVGQVELVADMAATPEASVPADILRVKFLKSPASTTAFASERRKRSMTNEIPKEVVDAARLVEHWFSQNCVGKRWQLMGICSRDYAYRCENTEGVDEQDIAFDVKPHEQ